MLTSTPPAPFLDSSLRWNDDEEKAMWIAIPIVSVIRTYPSLTTPLATPPSSFRRRPESSSLTSHSRKAGMLVFEALINRKGLNQILLNIFQYLKNYF